ncbi:hypothetical protein AX16_001405 [Volvariella volvacea WC 439]|nr:hypothetical protein AX16_001405 [Volvariella volvacea WC 439]
MQRQGIHCTLWSTKGTHQARTHLRAAVPPSGAISAYRSGVPSQALAESERVGVYTLVLEFIHFEGRWKLHPHAFAACCDGNIALAWSRFPYFTPGAFALFDFEYLAHAVYQQEMIKGVRIGGTGRALSYLDTLEVPIIENTPNEEDLKDSMAEAMVKYPDAAGVLVRRHGIYVWGLDWEKAKTQTECLDYLFEIGVKMKLAGLPTALEDGTNQ